MYIYGINPVLESLNSDINADCIYIQESKENKRIAHIINRAESKNIAIEKVKDLRPFLNNNAVHQGVVALFEKPFAQSIKAFPDDQEKLLILKHFLY